MEHVALLRFLTFSYSPLCLPAVHLRVLVSGYFISLTARAPQTEITVDKSLFHQLMKKKPQTLYLDIIDAGQRYGEKIWTHREADKNEGVDVEEGEADVSDEIL